MGSPLWTVDSFAERPFAGNPAAVCLLERARPASWMRSVAAEMNLSETAFLRREGREFRLRWFTPLLEIDLCGHGTLAAAHVLWESGRLPRSETARFRTRSGLLEARRRGRLIELDFPLRRVIPAPAPPKLAKALGIKPLFVGKTHSQYFVEVASESEVRALRPDFGLLRRIKMHGFIVTARARGRAYDFVSRYFAPAEGIPEDPVTGSAHCSLGPYWAAKLGKSTLLGYQASARGGFVRVRVGEERVYLGGKAITVLKGELR